MDRLEDEDIRAVWAYHFPKRGESVAARLALVTLIDIIKDRFGVGNPAQTAAVARRLGIPEDEWNQFEAES